MSPLTLWTAKYRPRYTGLQSGVMHIEDGSQEVGRKALRVATSPTAETNLAQFLPLIHSSLLVAAPVNELRQTRREMLQQGDFLGELEEDDRKRHIVTSLPSWYINFIYYSFLPGTKFPYNRASCLYA